MPGMPGLPGIMNDEMLAAPGLGPALLASSHYHRGQIYEELGDTDKALWHYGAFVELWREADPEYQPVVEDVRERMARLVGEGE